MSAKHSRRQQHQLNRVFNAGGGIRIHVSFFSQQRSEWLPATEYIRLTPPVMKGIIDHWTNGRLDHAALILAEEFVHGYRLPNAEEWLNKSEVDMLDLQPGDNLAFWN